MLPLSSNISEVELTYKPTYRDCPLIKSSDDAFKELWTWFPKETIALQERFIVAYLNRANKIIAVYVTSVGGMAATVADPRLILSTALKLASSSIILCHNHPSGNLKPSYQDEELTKKIKCGAKMLDITLIDHVIITPEGKYLSMTEEGIL